MNQQNQRQWIKYGLLLAAARIGLAASPTIAAVITPTSDFASSYYSANQSPTNLINDSHMIETGDVSTWTATPDGSANGMWHSNGGPVAGTYVVFDLGANYDLSAAYLWQMLQQPNLLSRGIKSFSLYASSDAPTVTSPPVGGFDLTDFTQILGTSTLAEGPASGNAPTQTFTLSGAANVRQIYLQVNSAWSGQTNDYVGLSEIKFDGTLAPPPVSYGWKNAAGGDWQTAGNWVPAGGSPGAGDAAGFGLNSAYAVSLSSDASVQQLNVSAGDVTLNLGGNKLQAGTINLSGGTLGVASLVNGSAGAGQVGFASLNFTDGTLQINGETYKPTVGPVTVSGTYTNSFAISGQAGTSANPTLKLNGGANIFTTGSSTFDGSILIGINGGQGSAIVTDTGSSLNTPPTTGLIVVGEGGATIGGTFVPSNGSLQLSHSAQAKSYDNVFIGKDGGTGSASVESGATLASTANGLNVGGGTFGTGDHAPAHGTLNITNGGHAGGVGILIGNGGIGQVDVAGLGSTLQATGANVNGNIYVGSAGGNGTLNLSDHAQAGGNFQILIGRDGGTGHVSVDGNASLSASSTSSGYLWIGMNDGRSSYDPSSNGALTLTNGGTATAGRSVLVGNFGLGTVNVDGAGSVLSGDGMEIGSTLGNGTLAVTRGGQVLSSGSHDGTLHIGTNAGVGQATVDGAGSAISGDNGIYIGDSVYNNGRGQGTLTLTNGGGATSYYGIFVGTVGGSGTLNVGKSDGTDAGGTTLSTPSLEVGSGVSDVNVHSIVNIYKGASIQLSGSLVTYANSAAPANTRVNFAGGTIRTHSVNLADAAHLNWTGGTLWLTGGASTTNGTLTVPAAGTLKGYGSISGTVADNGLISPNQGTNAIGTFNLNSGLTIGSTGAQATLAADIDFAASTADLLNVTGAVDLSNAALNLSLLNLPTGITTPLTFLLIDNDGTDPVAGQFASVDPGAFSNVQYQLNYAYNNGGTGIGNDVAITFTAVPEPGCLALSFIAGLALLRRRRSAVR